MKYHFFLLFLNTISLWFETTTSQQLQDYRPMHSLSLTLQAPKKEINFKPFFGPPQYQEFVQNPYQPQYEVKEYNEEYPIEQFQSIKDKYRTQALLPRNQFKSSTYSNYKSYQSKPKNKNVALIKQYQHNKKMERINAQLAQPQFQSLQHIKLSPIQLPEPQIEYANYHLQPDIPEIQLPSVQVQQQLQPPTVSYSDKAKFNEEYPVPSDELQPPSIEQWNPNNDSNLYYKVPSSLTKMDTRTNVYPKKYNPEVREKVKPHLGKPKQQIDLLPVTTETVENQQQEQNGKNENKKLISSDNKVQKPVEINLSQINNDSNEPVAEESKNGFSQGFDSDGKIHNTASSETEYNSAEKNDAEIDSPTTYHPNKPAPKDRVEFQMHGFDGPLSYKWGFDTGEGRNRHFRYEERDKLGHVKGHYGYYDKRGKLRMVHYNANPEQGFNAETENFGTVKTEQS